jgi:hypothetical protein
MARLAWIESEVGSAAGFPNAIIILQKSRPGFRADLTGPTEALRHGTQARGN